MLDIKGGSTLGISSGAEAALWLKRENHNGIKSL